MLAAVTLVAASAGWRWAVLSACQAAESERRLALAQKQIERDDRNVRRRDRKGERHSWYRIRPWELSFFEEPQRELRGAIVTRLEGIESGKNIAHFSAPCSLAVSGRAIFTRSALGWY